MTSYVLVYVLSKGAPLTKSEFDGNIHNLDDRVTALETDPPEAVGVDSITVSGDAITFVMTDATTRGPFTLPVLDHPLRGPWAAATDYAKRDWFTINGTLYEVLRDHTSAATFDAGANDGSGHAYYAVVITSPGNVLPTGGAAGQILAKVDGSDYLVHWIDGPGNTLLEDLSDVTFSTAGPDEGDVLTFVAGTWTAQPKQPAPGEIATTTALIDLSMNGQYLRCTHAAGCTVTVDSDATLLADDIVLPVGFEVHFRQAATGSILLLPESSTAGEVTIHPSQEGCDLSTQYQGATITLKRIGPDEYDMIGPPGATVT